MANSTVLLKNAIVVLPDGAAESFCVFIKDGRIEAVSSGVEIESRIADATFDLDGASVFAGFIDVHNHGAVGVDVNAADADDLHEVSKFLARNGVTAWLPTFVPDSIESYRRGIDAVDELMQTQATREPAARVLGVHYEGPFVNEKMCGALRVEFFKEFIDKSEADALPRLKMANAIYLTTVAPEIAGGIELIKSLTAQNWITAIGHTRADIETLNAAFDAGAKHLTHFFNAMTGLHHREIGVAGWGLINQNVTFDIIADNFHVAPQILKLACRTKTSDKVSLISDSVAPTGLGDGTFSIWDEKITVKNGHTQNERGSLAGSVITMLDAVKNLRTLNFTNSEISKMASLNPAKLLKIGQDRGSIETGKRADLTAINAAGAVVLTIIGGKIAVDNLT